MVPPERALVTGEELGKKDDDHHSDASYARASFSPRWRLPRRRRLLLAIFGAYLLYVFFKNIPTDLQPAITRYDPRFMQTRLEDSQFPLPGYSSPGKWSIPLPPGELPTEAMTSEKEKYHYDGEIEFPELPKSLRLLGRLRGLKNSVVFATSDLRSLSDLLPLACEMARQGMNKVHFAVMGRHNVSIEGIQYVNGISPDDCPIYWHGTLIFLLPCLHNVFALTPLRRWSSRLRPFVE
jgi:hypothetical protein